MMRRLFAVSLVVLVVPSMAYAVSKDDVSFYAAFDGDVKAGISKGDPMPIVKRKQVFVEGKVGQGLQVDAPKSEILYKTDRNLDLDDGTVMLWVKPVGWSSGDIHMRHLFGVREPRSIEGGQANFVWLYKFFSHTLYFLVQHDRFAKEVFVASVGYESEVAGAKARWESGRWEHVAATWNLDEMRVYWNGHYVSKAIVPTGRMLRELAEHFTVGGLSDSGKADLVVDELYIFNRPLTESEISEMMKGGNAALSQKRSLRTELELTADYLPPSRDLRLRASVVGCHPQDVNNMTLHVALEDTRTNRPFGIRSRSVPVRSTVNREKIRLAELPPGDYRLLATLTKDGDVLGQASQEIQVPEKPVWLGNKIGITDEVPKPWTPLKKTGDRVQCWGRSYEWVGSAFPTQVATQGNDLLARPVALTAKIKGRTESLKDVALKWTEVSPTRVAFEARGKLGAIPVTVDGWMEYDGFLWCSTKLDCSKPVSVEGLRLEIPMKPKSATLMQSVLAKGVAWRGKSRPFSTRIGGKPYIWLGNEKGGLQWCTEYPHQPWYRLADREHQVALSVSDKEVVYRVTFIEKPTVLEGTKELAFGLHATPVKPLPKGWRKWWVTEKIPHYWRYWTKPEWGADPHGYLQASPKAVEVIDKHFASDVRPLLYWVQNRLWTGVPDYRYWRSLWVARSEITSAPVGAKGKRVMPEAAVCPASASFRDYQIYTLWNSLKKNPQLPKRARGVYLDGVGGRFCTNAAHGCGLVDRDGTQYKRFSILGHRELQKRLYVMFQKNWPDFIIENHASDRLFMSSLSFAHSMVDGERLCQAAGADMGYFHVLSLADFRSQFMGKNFGYVPVLLTEVSRGIGSPKNKDPDHRKKIVAVLGPPGVPRSEHIVGMLLVHDSVAWGAYMNPVPFARLVALKRDFGWDDDTEFIPYWDNKSVVSVTSDQSPVVVSVFLRPHRVLFVVMNNSDSEATVELSPRWKNLGLENVTEAVDAYALPTVECPQVFMDVEGYLKGGPFRTDKHTFAGKRLAIPVQNGKVRFTVKKRNFRALQAASQ